MVDEMIFIDTNVFVAYFNADDAHHKRAVALMQRVVGGEHGSVFTSDYVFDESVTVALVRTKNVDGAEALGVAILGGVRMLKVTDSIFRAAWKLFTSNKKGLSFTDCTNVAFMDMFGIEHIATFDKGFEGVKGIKVVS
jgi:uncharacterized protein